MVLGSGEGHVPTNSGGGEGKRQAVVVTVIASFANARVQGWSGCKGRARVLTEKEREGAGASSTGIPTSIPLVAIGVFMFFCR